MNGSRVTAKIAGIESTAKTTSVASTTSSTGRSAVAYTVPVLHDEVAVAEVAHDGENLAEELEDGFFSGWVSTSWPMRIFPPV